MPSITKGDAALTKKRKNFTDKRLYTIQRKNYIERDYMRLYYTNGKLYG